MTLGTKMSSAVGERLQIDDDDWTWTGNVFQTVVAATGNERRPHSHTQTSTSTDNKECFD